MPLGSAAVTRPGADVTVVSYSAMALHAMAAAERLASDGIDAEVIDLRSLVPLDFETVLESVARTRRAVVAHESWRFGGFGAELAAQLHSELFGELEAPVARVGAASARSRSARRWSRSGSRRRRRGGRGALCAGLRTGAFQPPRWNLGLISVLYAHNQPEICRAGISG